MAEINFPERLSAVISVMTGNVALSNSFKGTIIHIAIMDFSFLFNQSIMQRQQA